VGQRYTWLYCNSYTKFQIQNIVGYCFPNGVPRDPRFRKEVLLQRKKAMSVTGYRGCETLRFPHFLENRLKSGGDVSYTRRTPFTPRKIPGTHFC
jgi:hypothetical protein